MMAKQNRIVLLFLLLLVGTMPVMAVDYLLNISANDKGTVQVYQMNGVAIPNEGSVTAGEKYRVIATCSDENYLFDHLEVTGGNNLVVEDKEKGHCTFAVSGTGSVTVKAVFVGKPLTLTLNAPDPEQGTYTVICNGKKIQSGGTVPYGSAITVMAEPKEGHKAEGVKVNEEIIVFTDKKAETIVVDAISLEALFSKIEFVTVVYQKKMPSLMTMTVLQDGEVINSNDEIPFGSKVDIRITDKWGYNFYFWINGTQNTLEKLNNKEYQCVVTAKEDLNIAITQAGAIIGVSARTPVLTLTYDGTPKRYSGYRMIPDGLSDSELTIKYRLNGTKDTLDTPPIEVGIYDVILSREQDDHFRKFTKTVLKALIIEKKKVEINQLPLIVSDKLTGGIAKVGNKQIIGDFYPKATSEDGNIMNVEFVPEDAVHYTTATCQIPTHNELTKYPVKKATFTDGVSFNILNGDYVLKEGEEVAEGIQLNVRVNTLLQGKKVDRWLNLIDNITTETIEMPFIIDKPLCLTVNSTEADKLPEIQLVDTKVRQEKAYTGGECTFSTLFLGKYNGKNTDTDEWIVNYTAKSTGKKVLVPFSSGEYEVSLSCLANDKHEAFKGEGLLVVRKSEPENVDFTSLRYTPVATGQSLKYAILSEGTASLPGKFTWKNADLAAIDGRSYEVLFTPKDTNFQTVSGTVVVNTRFIPYILMDEIKDGSVSILNKTTGKVLKSGDWLSVGDELVIKAQPSSGYTLQTLSVNSYSISNGSSYFVGDKPLTIEAVFEDSSAPSVPYYTVTIPEVTGAIISNTGTNSVKAGNSFSFVIDYDLLYGAPTVMAGGQKLAYDGSYTYTLTKVTQDTTVSISLPKYGHYTVTTSVDTTLARIDVKPIDAAMKAGTTGYAYGTELELTAIPANGVRFYSWWDGNTENPRIYRVRSNQKISANFRGIPTGIDSVAEALDIRSSGNNLYIQTDTECKARIIDMQGRMINQFMVSGTATYQVSQPGVYILILYKDNQLVLTKKIKIGQ